MQYKIKIDAFMKELAELSVKHGVYIKNCGCCGTIEVEGCDEKSDDWEDFLMAEPNHMYFDYDKKEYGK